MTGYIGYLSDRSIPSGGPPFRWVSMIFTTRKTNPKLHQRCGGWTPAFAGETEKEGETKQRVITIIEIMSEGDQLPVSAKGINSLCLLGFVGEVGD